MARRENSLPTLRIEEAARLLDVSTSTLMAWIKAGRVRAFKTPGGRIRLRREDLVEVFRPVESDTNEARS